MFKTSNLAFSELFSLSVIKEKKTVPEKPHLRDNKFPRERS